MRLADLRIRKGTPTWRLFATPTMLLACVESNEMRLICRLIKLYKRLPVMQGTFQSILYMRPMYYGTPRWRHKLSNVYGTATEQRRMAKV